MKLVNFHNTKPATGQIPAGWFCLLALLMTWLAGCHRMPAPDGTDPRLPSAYHSPARTFETWMAATLARDEAAIRDCYWSGMSAEEMSAWMSENLRDQAVSFFHNARFLGSTPVTLVEADFSFLAGDGSEVRGVMVRTREGWKIQRW